MLLIMSVLLFYYPVRPIIDCNTLNNRGLFVMLLCIVYRLRSMQKLPDHRAKFYVFWQYLLYAIYCFIIKPAQKVAHSSF